ncbi:MAG: hypothetical protein AB7N71_08395 [Phycisphaerae bacterium]
MRFWKQGMGGIFGLTLSALQAGCLVPPMNNNNGNTNANTNTNTNNNSASNGAPTAAAGADQTVERRAEVQLTAAASSDPEDDALSFSWEQTSGPTVTLNNANSATPTFVAPNTAATLVFEVTVSDGKGKSDVDTVTIIVTGATGALFVVNNDTGRITVHSSEELDGDLEPFARIDAGATTSLFQPRSVVVTPGGGVFASRQNGGIVAYGDSLRADGTKPADLVWEGNNTGLEMPISLAYDDANELLFVGNINADMGILVFDVENSNGGNEAPVRTFGPPDRAPFDNIMMTLDALWLDQGMLYASDTSGLNVNSSRILVFNVAATADGETMPDRIITSTAFGNIEDIVIDADEILYVVDGTNAIKVFDEAQFVGGNATPDRIITINATTTPSLQGIVVGSDGIGYVADRENDVVYTINGIGAKNGTVEPDAFLEGFNSRIAGPRQLFFLEN